MLIIMMIIIIINIIIIIITIFFLSVFFATHVNILLPIVIYYVNIIVLRQNSLV